MTYYLLFVFFCGEAVYQIPLPGKAVCERVLDAEAQEGHLIENEDGTVAPRTLLCVPEWTSPEAPCPDNDLTGAVWVP